MRKYCEILEICSRSNRICHLRDSSHFILPRLHAIIRFIRIHAENSLGRSALQQRHNIAQPWRNSNAPLIIHKQTHTRANSVYGRKRRKKITARKSGEKKRERERTNYSGVRLNSSGLVLLTRPFSRRTTSEVCGVGGKKKEVELVEHDRVRTWKKQKQKTEPYGVRTSIHTFLIAAQRETYGKEVVSCKVWVTLTLSIT